MKRTKINIPIYTGQLVVIVAKNFEKAAKKFNISKIRDVSHYEAFVTKRYTKKGTKFIVFFKPEFSMNTLSHEVTHLVNSIFEYHHIKLDDSNDEPQAYLTGWITEEVCKVLKKK